MGWIRACKYMYVRTVRLSDTTHKIAVGLAIGVGISFTPIVGTHFIQAGIIAYVLRANLLSSLIGTFVGNPWTFPFMWWAAISFGSYLFGVFGLPASTALPDTVTFSILWDIVKHQPLRIFLPWLLGGYLLGLIAWFPAYLIFYNFVKGAKMARHKARLRRVHKAAKEITGQKN